MLSKTADLIGKATSHRKWKDYGKEEGAFQRSGPPFAESAQVSGWPRDGVDRRFVDPQILEQNRSSRIKQSVQGSETMINNIDQIPISRQRVSLSAIVGSDDVRARGP